MKLDEKGVDVARKATALQFPGTWMDEMCLTFTRAYISTHNAELEREVKRLREALKLARRMMTKDSLCEAERLEEGLLVVCRALSTSPQGADHE